MRFLNAVELEKSEPSFLWRSLLSYETTKNTECAKFHFDRVSRSARLSVTGLFITLILAGIVEMFYGWPLYAPLLPLIVIGVGIRWQSSVRHKRFKECWIELKRGHCAIINVRDRWDVNPLLEVLIQNRWRHRDGSFIVNGESELYLITQNPQGHKLYFPLGQSGVLRDLDALAADISRATSCPLVKQYVK